MIGLKKSKNREHLSSEEAHLQELENMAQCGVATTTLTKTHGIYLFLKLISIRYLGFRCLELTFVDLEGIRTQSFVRDGISWARSIHFQETITLGTLALKSLINSQWTFMRELFLTQTS